MKIPLNAYPDYVRKLGKMMPKVVKQGIVHGAALCIQILREETYKAPPASPNGTVGAVDSHNYERSWKMRVLDRGAMVFNDAAYADVIEQGRRRNRRQPPTQVIERWLRRKGGMSKKEAKRAAFPVARAIGRRGLAGRWVFWRAKPRMEKRVRKSVEDKLAIVARGLK